MPASHHSDSTPDSIRVPPCAHDYLVSRTVQVVLQAAAAVVTINELAPALSWVEAPRGACDALNSTATTIIPESKSPHEMYVLLRFLKPVHYEVKSENKVHAKS